MNICIDAHLSENRLTGIGRYLNGLIPELIRQGSDHLWTLLVADDLDVNHPLSRINAKHVRKIPVAFRGPTLRQHLLTHRIVNRIKADIYHHPHFDLPLGIQCPCVTTIHDLKYLRHPQFFPQKSQLKTVYMNWAFKQSLRRSVQVIAISDFTRNDIKAFWAGAAEKTTVIHHGLDHPSWHGDDKKILPALPLKNPYILCVAEQRPHKNITTLIDSFSKLIQQKQWEGHLVISGKSYSDYTEPEDRVRELGLGDHIHFTGYVTEHQMSSLYNKASLFVLPSLYEGFGFPILEAMQAGVPVIAANTTAIPEIMGQGGLLFNAEDADQLSKLMKNLLNDSGRRKKLIEAGQNRAAQFTWARAAASTLKCYQKAIGSHKSK